MKTRIKTLALASILVPTIFIITGCGVDGSSSSSSNLNNPAQQITGFHYSFDETGTTIVDNSGNNYDGSPAAISRVPGKVGNAVKFLGSGSTIALNSIDYFPFSTGISFRAWIKIDQAITARQQIIGGTTGSNSAAPVNNFGISLINDSISFEVPAQQNLLSVTTNPLSLPLNTWFHLAVTYDAGTIRFYYNGSPVGTGSILTTFNSYFENRIGNNRRIFGGIQIEDQFLGHIDEIYLENKVLSQSEITTYYTSTM